MKKLTLVALLAGMSLSTSAMAADKSSDVKGIYKGDTETFRAITRPRPRPPVMLTSVVFDFGTRPRPRPPQALQSAEK